MSAWTSSPDLFKRLLNARTSAAIEAIMSSLPIVSPDNYQWDYGDKRLGKWQPGRLHWLPVGLERGNRGRIELAGEPMNPIAERAVNGMEVLVELARLTELFRDSSARMPANPRDAVLRYFGLPRLDAFERMDDQERKELRERVNQVRRFIS